MQNVKWHVKPLALLVILCMVLGIAPAVSIRLPDLTMTAYAATPGITFADINFKTALLATTDGSTGIPVDSDGDGEISTTEAAVVTSLNVGSKNISSLNGIEYFTSLEHLSCYRNQLTSIDLSSNTALIGISCNDNQLTSINVSNNPALTTIHCPNNQLTSLDVSNNPALEQLACGNNKLDTLDVSSSQLSP